MERLTEQRGIGSDGKPYYVLKKREGQYSDILQEALRKLAEYEINEEMRCKSRILYQVPHSIVVKGKCPVCGKKLGKDDNIFICQECLEKDLEYRKEHG